MHIGYNNWLYFSKAIKLFLCKENHIKILPVPIFYNTVFCRITNFASYIYLNSQSYYTKVDKPTLNEETKIKNNLFIESSAWFCLFGFSPDGHYWSTLNAVSVNPHLNTPGGYTGLNFVSTLQELL